jgi:hypothetical protein
MRSYNAAGYSRREHCPGCGAVLPLAGGEKSGAGATADRRKGERRMGDDRRDEEAEAVADDERRWLPRRRRTERRRGLVSRLRDYAG